MTIRNRSLAALSAAAALLAAPSLAQPVETSPEKAQDLIGRMTLFVRIIARCHTYYPPAKAEQILGPYREKVIVAAMKQDPTLTRSKLETGFAAEYAAYAKVEEENPISRRSCAMLSLAFLERVDEALKPSQAH